MEVFLRGFLFLSALVDFIHSTSYPNVIIFVADDLGFGDVGFNGATDVVTPNIDSLASDGIILTNYYVAPVCTPSRGALLSGLLPIHTGTQHYVILTDEPRGFPLNVPLLPEYLKQYNYSTHAVGKWHLGFHKSNYTPSFRGFDSHVGYWSGAQDYYDHSTLERNKWGLDFRNNLNLIKDATGIYSTTYFTNQCKTIIKQHNTKNPLFLYVAYQSVHGANKYARLQAPEEDIKRFPNIHDKRRKTFAGMLFAMDESIGIVFNALKAKGLLDNSIVIFTSDNGGPASGFTGNAACNWPLRGVKATLWEGGVRVPAFIWSPLLKSRRYVSDSLMHITDWLPTLLEAVTGTVPKNVKLDGYSLWKSFSEKSYSPRKEVLLNIDPVWNVSAIRHRDWKLIQGVVFPKWSGWYPPLGSLQNVSTANSIEPLVGLKSRGKKIVQINCGMKPANASTNCKPELAACLFDVEKDPCEFNNVADLYPEIVKELWSKILRYNETAVPPGNQPLDPCAAPILHDYTWTTWNDNIDNGSKCRTKTRL